MAADMGAKTQGPVCPEQNCPVPSSAAGDRSGVNIPPLTALDTPRAPWPAAATGRPALRLAVPLLSICLSACGANMRAALDTARSAVDGGSSRTNSSRALDPRLNYLHVQIGRQVGLMVRSDTPLAGDIPGSSHWYSADGALLRLQDGRLIGLTEAGRSWRVTQGPTTIDWAAIATGQALDFQRQVNQLPGYHIGLIQHRRLRAIPSAPAAHSLRSPVAKPQWFIEHDARGGEATAAWYAVDLATQPPRVLYGQTCLAADWCIRWQVWPPRGESS